MCITIPNLSKISQTIQEIWWFSIFQDGGCRRIGFQISNFELSERSRGSICVILRNFIEIGQTTAEIWLFFHFLRWQLSAMLDFYKCKILTSGPVRKPNTSHRAKLCEDRSNHSGDMAILRFFKMAAVRHIGFVVGTLGPPTKCTWWSLLLFWIWLESIQ